jgi:hypothetical protein
MPGAATRNAERGNCHDGDTEKYAYYRMTGLVDANDPGLLYHSRILSIRWQAFRA